ncbi:MAG: LCP family protein [Micropruina sp.]
MHTRSDRLVAVATLGAFVVVAGVLGLVSLYLGAVTQALAEVPRSSALPDYPGRPSPTASADEATPLRYLVVVTDDDGTLASAYLAQLSSRRDSLQLIGIPANLLVTDPDHAEVALSGRFTAAGGDGVARSLESMLGLRIDHLVELKLGGFLRVVDVLGGVNVQNDAEKSAEGWHFPAGQLMLSSADAGVYLSANRQPLTRLERTEEVFVEILRTVVSGDALTNPAKVEAVGAILRGCLILDADLTPGEIRRTTLDVHLGPDNIDGKPLPLAGVSQLRGVPVTVADQPRLAELVSAMSAEELPGWADRQTDPWAPLPTLPPR